MFVWPWVRPSFPDPQNTKWSKNKQLKSKSLFYETRNSQPVSGQSDLKQFFVVFLWCFIDNHLSWTSKTPGAFTRCELVKKRTVINITWASQQGCDTFGSEGKTAAPPCTKAGEGWQAVKSIFSSFRSVGCVNQILWGAPLCSRHNRLTRNQPTFGRKPAVRF